MNDNIHSGYVPFYCFGLGTFQFESTKFDIIIPSRTIYIVFVGHDVLNSYI